MFEAFHESDYRRFWTAQFLSNVGSWMQNVAQGWLVYHLTDSPFLLGFVAFANSAPTFFLMLPGGVVADQFDRKKVVAASQCAQALAALSLAISIHLHTISVWQICTAAVVTGIAMSFSAPAYQAMVIDLLDDRTRLPNAVMMNSLQFNLSRAIGPVIAGAALSAAGPFWCFFLDALSFLPLIAVLTRMKRRQRTTTASGAIFARLADGFRYVRTQRVVVILLGIVAATSLFGYPFMTLMPVLARVLFRNDAQGLGWLVGGFGLGAFTAALTLSVRTPRRRILRTILIALYVFAVALGSIALQHAAFAVVATLVVCGASAVVCVALCNTSIQSRVSDDMRGRVLSMYTLAFFAFAPLGNLIAGSIAEHRGLQATVVVMSSGVLLSAIVATVAFSRSSRESRPS
jgi:MFS family permease